MVLTIKPIQLPLPIFPAASRGTDKPVVASLSPFDILETLGRGSKGIVYKVVHNVTRDVRALKTYNHSATYDEVMREIAILESIVCPYITPFHGTVFSDSGAGWMPILMEFDLIFDVCYEDSPTLPEEASPDFQDFIRCCLEKNPSKRWKALQLLSHPFLINKLDDQHAPIAQDRPTVVTAQSDNSNAEPVDTGGRKRKANTEIRESLKMVKRQDVQVGRFALV